MVKGSGDIGTPVLSEEKLIPLVRAGVALRLSRRGVRVRDIAKLLNVTPAAVSQYIKNRRGSTDLSALKSQHIQELLDSFADRLFSRLDAGPEVVRTAELLEAAHQLMSVGGARQRVTASAFRRGRGKDIELLRRRLRLELSAAERYLELANRVSNDYFKLLLRLIASDSLRHGDVVSQLASWLESDRSPTVDQPDRELLKSMLSIEDSANEAKLEETVQLNDPLAKILLKWVDMDEAKHGAIVTKILGLHAAK
ncbi:MAG: hypothetical protein QXI37_02325 [Thermoprotei archaeon]